MRKLETSPAQHFPKLAASGSTNPIPKSALTNITMPGLQDLPFELLEHICELIAGNQSRNLISFSQVSKLCLATSSQSLWHTIPLRIVRRDQVQDGVNKLRHILNNRLSRDGRLRCISIRGRKSLDESSGKRSKLSNLQRAQLNNLAWQPLADILTEMPPLLDLEWEQHDLPPCILQSLNRHHYGCRLHMAGVRLNTDKTLDPHERPIATSAFMYEASLPLDGEYDLCGESLSARGIRGWYGIRVSLATIGKLSSHLTTARHPIWHQYWAKRLVHQPGPGEFELPLFDSEGPVMRYNIAAITTLDLSSEYESTGSTAPEIRCDDITMWSKVTRFSSLRILKTGRRVDWEALDWMTKNCSFASLETLNMGLHGVSMALKPSTLVEFLWSLPPLKGLILTGETDPRQFKEWIRHHAPTLRRLALEPEESYNSAFDLEYLMILAETPLPLLERLSINIKRTKGNSDEVSIYKMFGSMPKLQSIVLRLDCSDWSGVLSRRENHQSPSDETYSLAVPEDSIVDFWQRIWATDTRLDAHVRSLHIRDALINSAVDAKLAQAIFFTIQNGKPARSLPLERLEIRPHGGCDFGRPLFRFSADWSAVMQHIERSWLVQRRYPGLGSSLLTVNQLQAERPGKKCRLPKNLKTQAEAVFRKVWPVPAGAEGDWQKDWHSFPLAV